MERRFAILRIQKIKDWGQFDRRTRHCERSGEKQPANVDRNRMHLNRCLFPHAVGPGPAKERWRNRVGQQTVRRNAVLALEVFMGMSDDVTMSKDDLRLWKARNLRWLRRTFGPRNLIAGASNEDEKTPHLHAMLVPRDRTGKLNCRKILGDRDNMSKLQTKYAEAMAPLNLRRGLKGSKRKYVPQRRLYESRIEIERQVKAVEDSFADQLDRLRNFTLLDWNTGRKAVIAEVKQTMDKAKTEITALAEVAKDVLLAKRDAEEREQLVREKNEALTFAQNQKERADGVLKSQADLVRGIDLIPIASEILGVSPVQKGATMLFDDGNFCLEIQGRKFKDTKNLACRGAGAIDLVSKLTTRNFKGAVEYLLTRGKTEEIVADQLGLLKQQAEAQIQEAQPTPRILTLADLPSNLWKPKPEAWPEMRQHLVTHRHLDPRIIDRLNRENLIWAADRRTLAFARRVIDQYPSPTVGVTLLRVDSPVLQPRVLLPEQGGQFWVGEVLAKTNRAFVVANPLEALSYRRLFAIHNHGNSQSAPTIVTPQIISADGELPTPALIHQVQLARKRLVIGTNTPLSRRALLNRLPELLEDGPFPHWLEFEGASSHFANRNRSQAWHELLMEELKERRKDQEKKPGE
jgi:hypothetical protein